MRRIFVLVLCLTLCFSCCAVALAEDDVSCRTSVTIGVGKSASLNVSGGEIRSVEVMNTHIASYSDGKIKGLKPGNTIAMVSVFPFSPIDASAVTLEVSIAVTKNAEDPEPVVRWDFTVPKRFQTPLPQSAEGDSTGIALQALVLRDEAGKKIGTVGEREVVRVLGEEVENRIPVEAAAGTGTVSAKSLLTFSGEPSSAEVSASSLNLRVGPGMDYGVADILTKGESVSVLSESGGWAFVISDGKAGFVGKQWIETQVAASNTQESSGETKP